MWRGGGQHGQCLYRRHLEQRDQGVEHGQQLPYHAGGLECDYPVGLSLWRGRGPRGQCLYRRLQRQGAQKVVGGQPDPHHAGHEFGLSLWRGGGRRNQRLHRRLRQQPDRGEASRQPVPHHTGGFGFGLSLWRGGGRRGQCLYRRHRQQRNQRMVGGQPRRHHAGGSGSITPYGVAVDGAGNVYIADTVNNAIEEWTAASQSVTTLLATNLYYPHGVAVDSAGNVYIADTYHDAIKELPHAFVDPTAKAETAVAGTDTLPVVLPATANLTGPFAPASDSTNWLTIAGAPTGW